MNSLRANPATEKYLDEAEAACIEAGVTSIAVLLYDDPVSSRP
jgi:hypothetical protein